MSPHLTPWLYRNPQGLCLQNPEQPLAAIASDWPTPCYLTDLGTVQSTAKRFQHAISTALSRPNRLLFAIKANHSQPVLKTLLDCGFGLDIVSWSEGAFGLSCGCDPALIAFSGVGKTESELQTAIDQQIGSINVESEEELATLIALAQGRPKPTAVFIRVKPAIAATTHDKIATGRESDKFGISADRAIACAKFLQTIPAIQFCGLSMHLGSQLFRLEELMAAVAMIVSVTQQLIQMGIPIAAINLGGGLGVRYGVSDPQPIRFEDYAQALEHHLSPLPPDIQIVLEPGRCLVADAAIILTRVIRVKNDSGRRFVIVDAGMNDLIRPALYGVTHSIVPVLTVSDYPEPADIVGPLCETSDRFALNWPIPQVRSGDLLIIETAGAYGRVMANQYNLRPLPAEHFIPAPE